MNKFDKSNWPFLLFSAVVIFFVTVFCGGCGTYQPLVQSDMRSIIDYEGTEIGVPAKPQRIVTLSLGFDIMTMGLLPPERFVAVHINASDPGISCITEESRNIKTKLYLYPFETILNLQPDLIIASTWTQPEVVQGYRDLGYSVVVCKGPNNVEEVKQTIDLLAEVVNEQEAGRRVIKEMDRQLKKIADTLSKRTDKIPVGMLVSQMTSYGGKGCMFDELCTKARVCNGIAKMGLFNGQNISKEMVVACDPDFFMVSAPRIRSSAASRKFKEEYFADPALTGLRGLDNITFIPDRYLYSATQNCVYAIKGIANAAYGEVFDMSDEKLIKGY